MFRNKKKYGGVTVLEDGDAARRDLLSGATATASTRSSNGQSLAELEAQALAEAQSGKDSTRRALKLATEARETGASTAQMLHEQTQQLENMAGEIEVVHDYLDKSERIIDKMSKPKLVRMFQRKKPTGRGLDKVKAGKKERAARDGMRDAGVAGIDIDGIASGACAREREDERERERLELLEAAEKKRGGLFGKNKTSKANVGVREINEDYSHYSEGVAVVMREQDKDLDQIGDALADMKDLANAMNAELKLQDDLINEVQDFTSETRKRTKDNAAKITKIK